MAAGAARRYAADMLNVRRPRPAIAAVLASQSAVPPKPRRSLRSYQGVGLLAVVLGCDAPLVAEGQSKPASEASPDCVQPSVLVRKREGIVELSCQGRPPQRFLATFGQQPVGPKLREGDERTPEGTYHISSRVETPRFHRFLGVSYPNAQDIRRAKELGITRLGGGIGIHGVQASKNTLARIWLRLGHTLLLNRLWGPTDGCIGVANEDIEVLYRSVRVGTPVVITP